MASTFDEGQPVPTKRLGNHRPPCCGTGPSLALVLSGTTVIIATAMLVWSSPISNTLLDRQRRTRLESFVGSSQTATVVSTVTSISSNVLYDQEEAILKRAQDVAAFINSVTLSEQHLSIDTSNRALLSPEEQALHWLIDDDPLQLYIDTPADQFRLVQRFALLTLWFQQFRGKHAHYWIQTTGWLVDVDECHWFGIACEMIDFGGVMRVQNAVTYIFLVANNLRGTLPADLGLLQSTREFVVEANAITGTLPSSLGRWTGLENFDVSGNALSGSIPSSYAAWGHSIGAVIIMGTDLTGTLPSELAAWTNIRWFLATGTHLTGNASLDVMAQWTNLSWLDVSFNMLTGTLPMFINAWSRLEQLDLGYNGLTGRVPTEWPDSLQSLSLAGNHLTGTLPRSLNMLMNLELFDFSDNAFTGTLPDFRNGSEGWDKFIGFSVYGNLLTGSIPESIGTWAPNLMFVELGDNSFSGTLPESLGQATKMQLFDVADNALTGTLPQSLGQWTDIAGFAICRNAITGSIPESIGAWRRFQSALFDSNDLVGSVPSGLCQAETMEDLTADCVSKVTCTCCTECF